MQDLPWQNSWQKSGLDRLVQTVDAVHFECDGQQALITVESRFGPSGEKPSIEVRTQYKIRAPGQVEVNSTVETGWIDIPT